MLFILHGLSITLCGDILHSMSYIARQGAQRHMGFKRTVGVQIWYRREGIYLDFLPSLMFLYVAEVCLFFLTNVLYSGITFYGKYVVLSYPIEVVSTFSYLTCMWWLFGPISHSVLDPDVNSWI